MSCLHESTHKKKAGKHPLRIICLPSLLAPVLGKTPLFNGLRVRFRRSGRFGDRRRSRGRFRSWRDRRCRRRRHSLLYCLLLRSRFLRSRFRWNRFLCNRFLRSGLHRCSLLGSRFFHRLLRGGLLGCFFRCSLLGGVLYGLLRSVLYGLLRSFLRGLLLGCHSHLPRICLLRCAGQFILSHSPHECAHFQLDYFSRSFAVIPSFLSRSTTVVIDPLVL